MDDEPATPVCSKPWCKNLLPANGRYKTCDHCREVDQQAQRSRRARLKAERNAQNATSNRPHKTQKRAREDDEDHFSNSRQKYRPDSDDSDDELDDDSATRYINAADFFESLRDAFKASQHVNFQGVYPVIPDENITAKERVQMVTREIWHMTGYRFTVHDNRTLVKNPGHKTRLWCSQDAAQKRASKPSQNPDAKHRDTTGMKRYPCQSKLTIICCEKMPGELNISVDLHHHVRHVIYNDVSMPPEALSMVEAHVEWLTPSAMVSKIRTSFPKVSAAQAYRAWRGFSESHWHRGTDQLQSARLLLGEYQEEVDLMPSVDVPEGVEILAWGMKRIATSLDGMVAEIGMDATYNTNSKHLELYSIMAEYDNAGFPLSYCFLSTASAIEPRKRLDAIALWESWLKKQYGVNPIFIHVDKDMAEIGASKKVWTTSKISLCWWHLRRAVRTRMQKAKLATTPYDVRRACAEFSFIELDFIPDGQKTDKDDYEGGIPDDQTCPISTLTLPPSTLRIRLPPATQEMQSDQDQPLSTLRIRLPPLANLHRDPPPLDEEEGDAEELEALGRRVFCPSEYRDAILHMMERHYCAHPLVPGYAAPDMHSIKFWAVRQMYNLCTKHDLRELWAYLWENWYRKGRWELWARSAHEKIAILKTTMILEAHWRHVKHDFLKHFRMPRCDLLVWIILTKLTPPYYTKLDSLLVETGRYRDLCSWRKEFKKEWLLLEKRQITLPLNDAYRPDPAKWVCTCPAFIVSRFLICKHLVQSVEKVSPYFFLEAKRQRTTPFWTHPSLITDSWDSHRDPDAVSTVDPDSDLEDDEGTTFDDGYEAEYNFSGGKTFDEKIQETIDLLTEFTKGLEFQRQFRDQRFLDALGRNGSGFFRMAEACILKEKKANSARSDSRPGTWDKKLLNAMYYRARPSESGT